MAAEELDNITGRVAAATGTLTDLTGALAAALDAARANLAGVEAAIVSLEYERQGIEQAAPHADDIAAMFLRGLQHATLTYERHLGRYLNNRNWSDPKAAARSQARDGAQLATVAYSPLTNPDHLKLVPSTGFGEGGDQQRAPAVLTDKARFDLDPAAITYFLRDNIAAEIPRLVAKLIPAAVDGMRQADRAAELARLDAELDARRLERDDLKEQVRRAAAIGRPRA